MDGGTEADGGMTSEPTLHILEEFLGSPQAPQGALSLLELDGYLTAIVIGPEMIMPSEWIPGLWGGDSPVFENSAQAQTILGAVMARYNEIIRQLDKTPQEFRPLYMPGDRNERASTVLAGEWANGFWQGMLLRARDWGRLIRDRKARVMLAPILCFIEDDEGDHVLRADPEELDDLLIDAGDLIPHVVPVIQEHWKRHAGGLPPTPRAGRPGRNDPCPCGSGLKYKRCCGAN
jgi:uncharacterized protein